MDTQVWVEKLILNKINNYIVKATNKLQML